MLVPNLSIIPLDQYLNSGKKWDVFLCCSSFEDRCHRSSEILNSKNAKIDKAILHNYKETDTENIKNTNISLIEEQLRPISTEFHANSGLSVSSPKEGVAQLISFMKGKGIEFDKISLLVDITVFTKPFFFLLFKTLKERYGLQRFSTIYTEPERYRTGKKNDGEIILTEGLDRLESIPGFSGSSVYEKDALIIQLGFEGKRALDVFYHITPEMVFVINGFPAFQPGWHKLSLDANMRFLQESKAYEYLYSAPALDPFETKRVIENITKDIERKELNVVIAPLGTKMQALGAMLYALNNDTTKIVYPFPSYFKTDYSFKFGPSWIFDVLLY